MAQAWGNWLLPAVIGLVSGCAGPSALEDLDDLSWRAYVTGEDLRLACRPGTPDRYRLVVNARAGTPVRAYDVAETWDGGGTVRIHVLQAGDAARIAATDPVAAWIADTASLTLGPATFTRLGNALGHAPAGPVPGLSPSGRPEPGFGWLIAGCARGAWFAGVFPPESEATEPRSPLAAGPPPLRPVIRAD